MKILYIHQYFSTPNGSTGTRSYELAKILIKRGYEVEIICLSDVRAKTGLKGKFINGLRKGIVEKILVNEFDIPYSNNNTFRRRILNFLLFSWRSSLLVLKSDADLIYATSTPLTVAIPGILGKVFKRIPFIFEVRDLWPELPKELGIIKNPIVLWILDLLERSAYYFSDASIGLAPGICNGIRKKSFNKKKIFYIPNSCDTELFTPLEKNGQKDPSKLKNISPLLKKTDFVALFSGAHGLCNGLDFLIEVALELKLMKRLDIKLILIGEGNCKKKLQDKAKSFKLTNLIFLESVNKKDLASLIKNSVHCGMMILKNVPAFYNGTCPNKFFDYISGGLPVVINYPGWLSEIIKDEEIGISCDPERPTEFAKALIQLKYDNKKYLKFVYNASKLSRSKYSRKELSKKWIKIIEKVKKK